MPYVVEKGFIAVDGISLTVVKRRTSSFTLAIIPHTLHILISTDYHRAIGLI